MGLRVTVLRTGQTGPAADPQARKKSTACATTVG